jgi:hypothetical protein
MTLNTIADALDVTVLNSSEITFTNAGTYDVQFSAQLHHTGGGGNGQTVQIWFRFNGDDVPDSNTRVTVPSNAPYVVAAWDSLFTVNFQPKNVIENLSSEFLGVRNFNFTVSFDFLESVRNGFFANKFINIDRNIN